MKFSVAPEGFKKICEEILDRGIPPLIDPYAKKEPFWTLIMPDGSVPDMIKVTLREWEDTMKMKWPHRPKLRAGVGDASK